MGDWEGEKGCNGGGREDKAGEPLGAGTGLAEKSGVNFQTLASIEMCRIWTSDTNLVKIAEALEIDASEFFLPLEKNAEVIKHIVEANIKRIIQETYAECMAENVVDYFTKDKEQE